MEYQVSSSEVGIGVECYGLVKRFIKDMGLLME